MWIGKHLITGSLSISSEEQTASTSMPSVCREDIMQSGLITVLRCLICSVIPNGKCIFMSL